MNSNKCDSSVDIDESAVAEFLNDMESPRNADLDANKEQKDEVAAYAHQLYIEQQ